MAVTVPGVSFLKVMILGFDALGVALNFTISDVGAGPREPLNSSGLQDARKIPANAVRIKYSLEISKIDFIICLRLIPRVLNQFSII
jgi:hypothetical protein